MTRELRRWTTATVLLVGLLTFPWARLLVVDSTRDLIEGASSSMVAMTILHRLSVVARAPDSGRGLQFQPSDADLCSPRLLYISPI